MELNTIRQNDFFVILLDKEVRLKNVLRKLKMFWIIKRGGKITEELETIVVESMDVIYTQKRPRSC